MTSFRLSAVLQHIGMDHYFDKLVAACFDLPLLRMNRPAALARVIGSGPAQVMLEVLAEQGYIQPPGKIRIVTAVAHLFLSVTPHVISSIHVH